MIVVEGSVATLFGLAVPTTPVVAMDAWSDAVCDRQQQNQFYRTTPIKCTSQNTHIYTTHPNAASRQPTFARLDTLDPRMVKLCVPSISTILEPSTASSATATSPRFLDRTTLGTCGGGRAGRRRRDRPRLDARSSWCGRGSVMQRQH